MIGGHKTRRTIFWTAALAAAALLALAFKFHIARTTVGSNDVLAWRRFAKEVTTLGGLETYRVDPDMNHPPFIVLTHVTQ